MYKCSKQFFTGIYVFVFRLDGRRRYSCTLNPRPQRIKCLAPVVRKKIRTFDKKKNNLSFIFLTKKVPQTHKSYRYDREREGKYDAVVLKLSTVRY